MQAELDSFRQAWQQEIREDMIKVMGPIEVSYEDKKMALDTYKEGMGYEEKGYLSRAVMKYRQAIKLWPQLEFEYRKTGGTACPTVKPSRRTTKLLMGNFRMNMTQRLFLAGRQFTPASDGICLFESLPNEVMNLIFKHAIGKENDFVTLERLSLVCSSFHLRVYDNIIWKEIYDSSTNISSMRYRQTLVPKNQIKYFKIETCYHTLFLTTPHILFNGYYGCKLVFRQALRNNPNAFTTVVCHRSFKLCPDGTVYYAVYANRLAETLNYEGRHLLKGEWKLNDDVLTLSIKLLNYQEDLRIVREEIARDLERDRQQQQQLHGFLGNGFFRNFFPMGAFRRNEAGEVQGNAVQRPAARGNGARRNAARRNAQRFRRERNAQQRNAVQINNVQNIERQRNAEQGNAIPDPVFKIEFRVVMDESIGRYTLAWIRNYHPNGRFNGHGEQEAVWLRTIRALLPIRFRNSVREIVSSEESNRIMTFYPKL